MTRTRKHPHGFLALAVLSGLLALLLVSTVVAQETPEATPEDVETPEATPEDVETPADADTPEATTAEDGSEQVPTVLPTPLSTPRVPPDQPGATLIRMELQVDVEPVEVGGEVRVDVLLEEVDHMSGFDVTVLFEPDRLRFEGVEDRGQFLVDGTAAEVLCPELDLRSSQAEEDPDAELDQVSVLCNMLSPPVCLGGEMGVSGDGLLGTFVFSSRGGGETTLRLVSSTIVLDDAAPPCPPDIFDVQAVPHNRGDPVTVELSGGEDDFPWLIVIIAIVAVAVIAVAGAGAYVWYQRRSAAAPPDSL